jgi:Zn-dependent M28 family amino/carboxypeptidase
VVPASENEVAQGRLQQEDNSVRRRPKLLALGAASIVTGAAVAAPSIAAVPTDTTALRDAVTVEGVRAHQQALQQIANENNGTRASGTSGYDESADYVQGVLEEAGYTVDQQEFDYEFFVVDAPAVLDPVSPDLDPYEYGVEIGIMEYSGAGDVTAPVTPVDLVLPPGAQDNTSNSGCEASDFTGFPVGNIALIQRGTCTFRQKADNAVAAQASAVIIFNEGQPGRTDLIFGTLDPPQTSIPVLDATFAVGNELAGLAAQGELVVRAAAFAHVEQRTTTNVIADSTSGRTDRTVMAGAHLDSVDEGPGINDNGSGTAAILETAEQMAELGVEPRNAVRFAFWGAEESGLIGSQHYVDSLTRQQLNDIEVYLNFDMVGSPNFVRFVYDGDGSAFGIRGPSGSGHVEDTFVDFFASQNLESEPTAFDGRSDYDAFINAGIPAGGLFTGAEGIKTAAQVADYGGTAGVAYDPCYHLACDTFANVSLTGLDQMSDAIAHATLVYAMTTSDVNGTGKASSKAAEAQLEFHGNLRIR